MVKWHVFKMEQPNTVWGMDGMGVFLMPTTIERPTIPGQAVAIGKPHDTRGEALEEMIAFLRSEQLKIWVPRR